ncbi:elongation factor P--(R)-beta-lysine ligase [Motilimonas pumila]|uniref:Elongation factor P--(R)-beta-lysine ligase n=1 Tax=Motilimonas pumila TaxID=2303987 RepID=A0A418YCZ5_9GAMM|nr:elongation factor P--(R)-beta-lysine ligase [Motilimonas pumila]RJG42376.1 elongation factor P--(R)-beta-lysine ligase [Motilimonas pumila]
MSFLPHASIENLRRRAQIVQSIRQFFATRNVMEVDTPAMSQASITDYHLVPFQTEFVGPGASQGQTLFLQTSPEFHMKRLLAAGSGAIYQMAKAFRNEESGRYHNPEFTMLEWYQPGYDHFALMAELAELVQLLLNCDQPLQISYQQAFVQHLGFDPLTISLSELIEQACHYGFADIAKDADKDTLLQLLFCTEIEPKIGQQAPCFVYDFPASQAALANISPTDNRVAERFELYFKGIELANGFHELTDAQEQLARFQQDNAQRAAAGKPVMPIDRHLIAALQQGLPQCAGVAVGVDRLVMLALQVDSIEQVLSFAVTRA